MTPPNDQYADPIRDLIPINGLPEQHQEEVVERGQVVKYRKGRYVFKQGDKDNYSFYLIDGELELIADGQAIKKVSAGTEDARHALAQLQPRQLSARANSPLHVFRIDRTLLDRLLADDRFVDEGSEVEVEELDDGASGDWMSRMLASELFSRLPASNIQSVFTRMESVEASAGEVIVEQGTPGDYYYIVQTGRCLVTRKSDTNGDVAKLAELNEGDSFGEEALVSESKRNATVTMLTNGQLMRLAKSDFNELIKKPTLTSVTYAQAAKLVAEGAVWMDVRFSDEHKASGIKDSLNLPLNLLRARMRRLDPEKRYVVYCDSGGRSSAGAFLLAQHGYDASYLAGGLIHSPIGSPAGAGDGKGKAGARPPARSKAPAKKAPGPAPGKAPVANKTPAKVAPPALAFDKAVKAAAAGRGASLKAGPTQEIEQELATVKQQLEAALKLKSEAEAARSAVEQAMDNRLRKEHEMVEAEAARAKEAIGESQRLKKEIEEIKRVAEKDETSQESAQRKFDRDRADAGRKLREEKQRLEKDLDKTAQELKEVQRKRDEAEARLREETTALSERTRETERRLSDVTRMKDEAETARKATEAAMEDSLRTTRAKLHADAKQAQESAKELERLKKQVEQARQAAEAERRHKLVRDKELQALNAETEARLQEEERSLKTQQTRFERELANLKRMKEQAEQEIRQERIALKQAAEDATKRLEQARQLEQDLEKARRETERGVMQKREELRAIEERLRSDEVSMMERVKQTLAEERRKLEAELAGSREALARAQQQAREAAVAERRAAEKEAERVIADYKQAHEMVLADELDKVKLEREQLEAEAERAQRTLAEAQRIQREAEQARAAAQREIALLRASQAGTGNERPSLSEKMKTYEEQADRASEELQAVERVSEVAKAARDASLAELERQREEEERLREQNPDDRDRLINPAKLEEIKRQRDELIRAQSGRRNSSGK